MICSGLGDQEKLKLCLELCFEALDSWDNRSVRIQKTQELARLVHALTEDSPTLTKLKQSVLRLLNGDVPKDSIYAIQLGIERELQGNLINTFGTDTPRLAQTFPLHVALDSLRSAHNVGSILRSSDGFGAECVHFFGYTPQPEHIQVKKTSKNAEPKWKYHSEFLPALTQFKQRGLRVYGIENALHSSSLFSAEIAFPSVMVFGNERFGLSKEHLNACDELLSIPMFGMKASLNVANAVSVCLFEARRQWQLRSS